MNMDKIQIKTVNFMLIETNKIVRLYGTRAQIYKIIQTLQNKNK